MARGGTKGWNKLRFIKFVFRDDGSEVMYLPPMIARKVPQLAGRETEIEDASGSRWPVTVSEVNGSLAFQRGWPKFFSDHRLKTGEVLVFKYIRGSHFVVRIFGLSACDRDNFYNEMPRPIKRATRNPGPVVEEEPFQTHSINNFDNEIPRPIKRAKKNPGPAVEEEPFQKDNINSRDIPLSDTPVASKIGRSQVPMDMEVMMKKEDCCYQGEDRTIWDDLSKFEPTLNAIISLPSPNESEKVSKSDIGFSEQAKSIGDLVQMDEVYTCQVDGHSDERLTDKLEKPLYTNIAPFHSVIVDKTKISGHDAEIDVIQTNQIEGHSDDILTEKFKKAVETKTLPFHHEITKQAIEKGCDTQTAAIRSSRAYIKHLTKPSESSSSRKGIVYVSSVQNESCFRKSAIKKEIIGMEDEAIRPPQASSRKESTMVDNHEPVIVKDEPQFYVEKAAFAPFEAEVKSKLYLELTKEVTSFRNKERGKIGKIVYLRDSKERMWPFFYPNKAGVMELCLNWSNFCDENKIEPGDKCRFQFEKAMPCILRVEVIPASAEVPHQ